MTDNNERYDPSEEFHFSPETQEHLDTSAFSSNIEKDNPAMATLGKIDRHKILMIIGGIIVFFAFYKLFTYYGVQSILKKKNLSNANYHSQTCRDYSTYPLATC